MPEDVANFVFEMLQPLPVSRPKFSEVVAFIDMFKAKQDGAVSKAQIEMVMTKTRPIPAMESLATPKVSRLMKLLGKKS